jgi:hypothetical protein
MMIRELKDVHAICLGGRTHSLSNFVAIDTVMMIRELKGVHAIPLGTLRRIVVIIKGDIFFLTDKIMITRDIMQ